MEGNITEYGACEAYTRRRRRRSGTGGLRRLAESRENQVGEPGGRTRWWEAVTVLCDIKTKTAATKVSVRSTERLNTLSIRVGSYRC